METISYDILSWGFVAALLISALMVVSARNPVYSALSLIFTLLGTAVVFAIFGAGFLAVAQVILYAGAIVVMFVFVLMLVGVKHEKFDLMTWLLLLLAAALGITFFVMFFNEGESLAALNPNPSTALKDDVVSFGRKLFCADSTCGAFNKWILAFEASAFLLFSAVISSLVLTKSGRKK